jgi:signal peptidase II
MASTGERRRFAGAVVAVIALDLLTKFLAEALLPRTRSVRVLGDFFQLQLVYNPGAAFGLHVGAYSRWFFMVLTLAALVVLGVMARQTRSGDRLRFYAIAAVMAGATGNLIDRVRSARGVVDYLLFSLGPFRWPNFNVADMAVSCGAIALALALWSEGRRLPAAPPAQVTAPPDRA